jgi:hypothetical protein
MVVKMIYYVDIDGTICITENSDYQNSTPIKDRINHFNALYDAGNDIHYWTARGMSSNMDHSELTVRQLAEWGVKYTSVNFKKPQYDIWIDDKAQNVDKYFEDQYAKDQAEIDSIVNM